MARMIPPIYCKDSTRSERLIFNKIERETFSEEWVCFHSLGLTSVENKRAGEIDFLLLVPGKGIYALEVKGGNVSVNERGVWRYSGYSKAESPFKQARTGMHSVVKAIKSEFGQMSKEATFMFGYGVITPDMNDLPIPGCDGDKRVVFCKSDLYKPFKKYLQRLHDFTKKVVYDHKATHYLNTEDIERIVVWLIGIRKDSSKKSEMLPFADSIGREQMIFTQKQYRCLKIAEEYPRAIVTGGAGTGKTLIACKIAEKESLKGRVLFLCYNRFLAAHLRNRLPSESINVMSLYSFFVSLIRKSSFRDEFYAKKESVDERVFFQEMCPEYAELAMLEGAAEVYDYLVIDEAQDILTGKVMQALGACLRHGIEHGRWCIFLDKNWQAGVFGKIDKSVLTSLENIPGTRSQQLYMNCRNTKEIVNWIAALAPHEVESIPSTSGFPVSIMYYEDAKEQKNIFSHCIQELLQQGIKQKQISILSAFNERAIAKSISGFEIEFLDSELIQNSGNWMKSGSIKASSISSYKGLENDFVILTDIEKAHEDWWKSILYTGMSRARIGLYVLMNKKTEQYVTECLKEYINRMGTTN